MTGGITEITQLLVPRLRSSCKNEMAQAPELSGFVSMAPELCYFITWLRLRSCVFS